ncbi:MAG: hypothetical protein A2Z20_10930 [Bdellovibrionales bacterium RBG_16_40_8]|nr:MAG: hypothetical protein A2Z20_10930 [Bdellovibrionales bacterium RBG_16_40_8]
MQQRKIIIVGGGAAGFFAAINAAELAKASNKSVDIQIIESSSSVLKKIRISGGGYFIKCFAYTPAYMLKNYFDRPRELDGEPVLLVLREFSGAEPNRSSSSPLPMPLFDELLSHPLIALQKCED